ncbi:TMV resistance protein N-like [Dorcoceras hygrometricum]|uniref:TMV resistance protein N-like n=1 Tax=Dorcoceras hygrometricum TaxID=472368 RepID=A0A2Z7A7X9_9LAMI|nr:TMV resistance protein N-like [Dorcoceras hygrometricum]
MARGRNKRGAPMRHRAPSHGASPRPTRKILSTGCWPTSTIARQAHGAADDVLVVMRDKARMLPPEICATIEPDISSSGRPCLGLLRAASARNSPHQPCNLHGHRATSALPRAGRNAAMRGGAVEVALPKTLPMLNTLSSVTVRESRIQYLCDPQWFRDTASRGPTTIVAPESQFRTCPTDHVNKRIMMAMHVKSIKSDITRFKVLGILGNKISKQTTGWCLTSHYPYFHATIVSIMALGVDLQPTPLDYSSPRNSIIKAHEASIRYRSSTLNNSKLVQEQIGEISGWKNCDNPVFLKKIGGSLQLHMTNEAVLVDKSDSLKISMTLRRYVRHVATKYDFELSCFVVFDSVFYRELFGDKSIEASILGILLYEHKLSPY